MANKPFDQRVINMLERPTSSALNLAQSQLNMGSRVLMRQLLQANASAAPTGSVGASFFVSKIGGTSRDLRLSRGIGAGYRAYDPVTDDNIGGITGLEDTFDLRLMTVSDPNGIVFTVPENTTPGVCRRDLIAIRPLYGDERLQDYTATDIYDPAVNKFNTISKPTTFSYDLSNQDVQYINYNETPTAPVVYIKGEVSPYYVFNPDSILNAPIPAPSGYVYIAVINAVGGEAEINTSDVIDYRRLISPNGNLTINGTADIGSTSSGGPGAELTNLSWSATNMPAGLRVSIYKAGAQDANQTNTYVLAVFGARGVFRASVDFSLGYNGTNFSAFSQIYPAQIRRGPMSLNQIANDEAVTVYSNATKSAPTVDVAIGQPVHYFPFTLGKIENVLSPQTVPVSGTVSGGTVTIPTSPNPNYPGGEYELSYPTVTQTAYRNYYLNYDAAPVLPDTGLPSPTYNMDALSTGTTVVTYTLQNVPSTFWTRVAGFVSPPDITVTSANAGVWNLTLWSSVNYDWTYQRYVKAQAFIYTYDGTSNPEDNAPIASSAEIYLRPGLFNSQPEQSTLSIPLPIGIALAGQRVYTVIKIMSQTDGIIPDVKLWFGSQYPSTMTTTIPDPTPYVEIPTPPTTYPAGTYNVDGGTSSATVTINLPGAQQKFNPAAEVFQMEGVGGYRTLPMSFTVNLTMTT